MDIFFNLFQGQAYINGFNLGRYWPTKGPQITLYVPAPILKPSPAINTLVLFELEYTVCGDPSATDPCTVEFIDRPIINATIPPQQATVLPDEKLVRPDDGEDIITYCDFITDFIFEYLWAITVVAITTPSLLWAIF